LTRSPKIMRASLPPPSGFSDNPEYMQHWLRAKAEDDRRGQEEEKTRQETLKLERRKIEQAILADSLRAGVPPHMLPLLFAGMNGAGAANVSSTQDMIQEWAQASGSPRSHDQSTFPGPRITPLPPLARYPQTAATGPQSDLPVMHSTLHATFSQSIPPDTATSAAHIGSSQSATAGALRPAGRPARVVEEPAQGLTPPNFTSMRQSNASQPPPQRQRPAAIRTGPRSRRSSPSISFHHWVPPQAHMQAKGQNSSSRKRKSSYSHHPQVPTSSTRSSDMPAGTASSEDRKSLIEDTLKISPRSQHQRHQSNISCSYESREEDCPGPATPVEQLAAAPESRRDQIHHGDIKHEEDRTSPDREVQEQHLRQELASDNESLSTPSLHTGRSIKSGGTSGLDRP
jgi:hypothetical protein